MEAPTYTQSLDRQIRAHAEPAVSLGIPAGPDSARAARRELGSLRRHVDPEVLQNLRLLASELVTNAVRHSGMDPGGSVNFRVTVVDGTVHMTVADTGKGFMPRPRDDDMHVPGGWGLVLVDQLADRWGVVNDDGSRVWLEIDRRAKN